MKVGTENRFYIVRRWRGIDIHDIGRGYTIGRDSPIICRCWSMPVALAIVQALEILHKNKAEQ